MRLIDADELNLSMMLIAPGETKKYCYPCREILKEIDDAPTIEPRCEACEAFNKTRLLIPQPERKKGKWIFKERREPVHDLSGVKTWGIAYMCSECGFIHTVIEDFGQYAYCPNSNCGAEMEGQDERDI